MMTMESGVQNNTDTISLDRVKALIQAALAKRFPGDYSRQQVRPMTGRLAMCCPYCGDSAGLKVKRRGNIYTDTLFYKCYNGGCESHGTLKRFAKDFDVYDMLTAEEWACVGEIVSSHVEIAKKVRIERHNLSLESMIDPDLDKYLVPRKRIMQDLRLLEVLPGGSMGNYLQKRFQPLGKQFAWDAKRNLLYIFNLDRTGEKVYGLQYRNMSGYGSKYLTYQLSKIYENLLEERDEKLLEGARKVDRVSTVFGISKLNFNDVVTVFEGPLDSFLFHNAAAVCSIKNDWPFDTDNYRWMQDNDEDGRRKAMQLLERGVPVFLWSKFLEDNNLTGGRKIKDNNDIVIEERLRGKKFDLESYFSSHSLDGIFV